MSGPDMASAWGVYLQQPLMTAVGSQQPAASSQQPASQQAAAISGASSYSISPPCGHFHLSLHLPHWRIYFEPLFTSPFIQTNTAYGRSLILSVCVVNSTLLTKQSCIVGLFAKTEIYVGAVQPIWTVRKIAKIFEHMQMLQFWNPSWFKMFYSSLWFLIRQIIFLFL